ncbi:MAG: right-handed parallel beta-helix repeat-containing protein [Kiritimatiellia bacterium]
MLRIHTVVLAGLMGMAVSTVHAADYYVASTNPTPEHPYATWATAATNIQEAVNAASNEDTIMVRAGVYTLPANPVVAQSSTNVLYITKSLTLLGVDGPEVTFIDGENLYRGLYVNPADNIPAVLDGFTILNGRASQGGGVYMLNANLRTVELRHCILESNQADTAGGGLYIGPDNSRTFTAILSNCVVRLNTVISGHGGAMYTDQREGGQLFIYDSNISYNNCLAGTWEATGGIYSRAGLTAMIERSVISYNTTSGRTGALMVYGGNFTLRNCLLVGNGGSYAAITLRLSYANLVLQNSVIADSNGTALYYYDSATVSGYNTILYNDSITGTPGSQQFEYSCRYPTEALLPGISNINLNPLFIDPDVDDYRLSVGSPCIDTGFNQPWMTNAVELVGNPRLSNGTVDMGCYEYPFFGMTVGPAHQTNYVFAGQARSNLTVDAVATNVFPGTAWLKLAVPGSATNWLWPESGQTGLLPASTNAVRLITDPALVTLGSYTGTVSVVVTNAGLQDYGLTLSNEVAVTMNVLDFNVTPGLVSNRIAAGTTPGDQTLTLGSAGVGEFGWEVSTPPAWLAVTPSAGRMTNEMSVELLMEYQTSALAPGNYTVDLEVFSADWGGTTQQVSVVLDILGLEVAPLALSNAVFQGSAPVERTLTVRNAGPGTFDYTSDSAWLTLNPGAGTAGSVAAPHAVTLTHAGLAPGAYAGLITVTGGGMTQQVAVALDILSLAYDPDPVLEEVERGSPGGTQVLDLWNAGSGLLELAVSKDGSGWFTVSPTNGTSSGPDDVLACQVEYLGLELMNEGAVTGRVTVVATDGGGGSLTQQVEVVARVLARVPGWLRADEGQSRDGVGLQWQNTRAGHYQVWRARASDFSDAQYLGSVEDEPENSPSYFDTTAVAGWHYYYAVRPANLVGGYGRFSPIVSGWRLLVAPLEVSATEGLYNDRVIVSWEAAPGATEYEVWRNELNTPVGAQLLAGSLSEQSYSDFSPEQDRDYYYWVKSQAEHVSDFSVSARGFSASLLAPGQLSASQGQFEDKVRVTWQGVTGARSYEIWRGAGGSVMTLLAETQALGYDDPAVTQGQAYHYRVRSRSLTAQSVMSEEVAGYADRPKAGLDLSDLSLSPGLLRAGGRVGGLSVTLGNRGPRSLQAPDDLLRFDLIFVPVAAVAGLGSEMRHATARPGLEGHVNDNVWTGTRRVPMVAGNSQRLDLRDMGIRLPARLNGEYNVFLRVTHASSSRITGADLGDNVVALIGTVRVRRGTVGDWTGDWLSDLILYDEAGNWAAQPMAGGPGEFHELGLAGGLPVRGDFDGDGLADAVLFRDGLWSGVLSGGRTPAAGRFGGPGWQGLSGDFDGDGVSDPTVYDPGTGQWQVLLSGGGQASGRFGGPGWVALTGDFDGDGLSDPAIYHAATGTWMVSAGAGLMQGVLGGPGWEALTGDFDGDGITDAALYHGVSGSWMIYLVGTQELLHGQLGGPDYRPVAGDFDGDGVWDVGVYRSDGRWFLVALDGREILWNWSWGGGSWQPVR